jgi:hypothetical protein
MQIPFFHGLLEKTRESSEEGNNQTKRAKEKKAIDPSTRSILVVDRS